MGPLESKVEWKEFLVKCDRPEESKNSVGYYSDWRLIRLRYCGENVMLTPANARELASALNEAAQSMIVERF